MSKALVPATAPLDEPLRSSLKCPSSPVPVHGDAPAPVFPDTPPPNRKRVRFKDGDEAVESICVFRPNGRPSALLTAHSSDTESDTEESEEDAPSLPQYISTVPIPIPIPVPLLQVTDILSPVPSPRTPPHANVRLESISPLPARPPLLRGTVHVRNVAFEKRVAARFTTDGWTTVSESLARYTGPAPHAPGQGDGDSDGSGSSTWDRFVFSISLELCARAAPRKLFLAVRFTAPGVGEWWDNNGGENFCVVLGAKKAAVGAAVGGSKPAARTRAVSGGGGGGGGNGPPSAHSAEVFPRRRSQIPARSRSDDGQASLVACARPLMTPHTAPAASAVTSRYLRVA